MIPYSTQEVSEADVRAVSMTLRSSHLTQGPAVERFERAIARYTGARFAVAFSSGTAALHAAYFAAGIKSGDEVIVPALTFAASANAALYVGARPVFADIDPESATIDPKDAGRKITQRTRVLAPVDYGGRPSDMRTLASIAKKRKLVLILDAAHSLGAHYRGRPVGNDADMTMFSFHPVKSITTGEGGAIVTNSATYRRKLLLFRHHGISKEPSTFVEKKHGAWYQEMQVLGYNYRLSDIQSALGESQMKRLDAHIEKRRHLAKRYRTLLRSTPHIALPPEDTREKRSAWHLYPIRLVGAYAKSRDSVFSQLRENGIGVQVHYLPVYMHQYYRRLGYKKGLCPKAEAYAASEISLPIFPSLTERDQKFVVSTLKDVLRKIRKLHD
ncbi:UDP-4-amino-4,6-dideoxy-N-acetyl-beta-L-altrosamine transaminase [Candidatus Kaiserbacteria bacterium RIFCSPLOWO2_01_FULL_54_13]|uniref:UDP-4-amino-4, 6-dideoxy-N-acetyl-beta-L-altrosamine transaminase n=1 Tax=Candidatus Kaiserbacteria bacterium RIFCSPLOWO2_01_FULL_54_13 TaxID=1798512 RepID=A0A1F6F140_9BACT|nr:MAG: UDP-4-amino-4,6-dideoxy-N-acetyl-beta-L-altrosamine transaminase [Candidatus Kaiserbacteria bacterium RIFCSPLOWO2_01_FULL_54_13]